MRNCLRYTLILILVCSLFTSRTNAQDPNFSQFFASPMTLNPALIGKGVADWRAIGLYRTQWFGNTQAQPYTTANISLEKKISDPAKENDQLAMGLLFLSDASNAGLLKNNYASLGISYQNALDRDSRRLLGGGISFLYHNRIVDPAKFVFQSQYGSGGYQPGTGTPDGVNIAQDSYFDINAGIHLSERKEKIGYTIGVSYFHAARPKDGAYQQNSVPINPRLSLQGSMQVLLKNKDELLLSAVANMQGGGVNDIYTLGAMYKINMKENDLSLRNLSIGVWNRTKESINAYIGIESSHNWLLGISYDFILTDIKTSYNSLQSMEFSFGWQFAGKKHKAALASQKAVLPFN